MSTGDSYISRVVREELPRYRAITKCTVGNGITTSFWHDSWLLETTLADTFPALKSHLLGQSLGLPSEVKTDVMLLWHMWKARNSLIFDQVVLSPQNIIRRTISTMEQWTVRYRKLSLHWNVWIEFTLKI
nr:unnamed protein product [Digitaria exilis]